jgi:hypothetical protein
MSCSPRNKEELFNLCHASTRNIKERIFGVLKGRFRILLLPAEFSLEIQGRIPAGLCVIHNFIRMHEPSQDNCYRPTLIFPDFFLFFLIF